MSLRIYNVLSRKKELFKPIEEGRVNMYVCGPTVYDYSHIGHAKTYVGFDVVVRYLRYIGYDVLYVQNITDVGHLLDDGEDRILKKARQSSSTPMQIVEKYTKIYFDNMDALLVQRPDISPRASAHIPEQIEMIEELIKKEHAYEVNGSVYFDVSSFEDYGKLSGRKIEEQEEGHRLETISEKRHPNDFALWKKAEPEHILRWNSPWSEGFPGWHVECSAMAKKYLGETFDIHGGGIDNIFPHNECEIAQSEAAHGEEFANYWMLTGSLTRDGVKMSKSLGNGLPILEALEMYRPESIRYFMLTSHYSNPIDFSDEALAAVDKGWQRLNSAVTLLRSRMSNAKDGELSETVDSLVKTTKAAFIEKMNDDFNAPAAIAVIQDLTRKVNGLLVETADSELSSQDLGALDQVYRELGGDVLGIVSDQADSGSNAEREAGLLHLIADIRQNARTNKDWATSDQIRDQLKELGITLKDGADGTTWSFD